MNKRDRLHSDNRYAISNRVPGSRRERGNRFEWLSDIIISRGYTCGAEIGCAKGKTTSYLLKNCPQLSLYAVDLWEAVPDEVGGGTEYKKNNFKVIEKSFKQSVSSYSDQLIVLKGISWEMAERVKNGSLDFVFIDADHEYESVKKDILAWSPKLRPGGLLCGHDIHFIQVRKAVQELIPDYEKVGVDYIWKRKENK